jgi:hypothetical protein
MSDPAPQRRQPAIAGRSLIATVDFQAGQKVQHLLAGNVGQRQAIHPAMSLLGQVHQEQP